MEIAFEIPTWLLWVLGIPAGIAILFFAVIGIVLIWNLKDWHL